MLQEQEQCSECAARDAKPLVFEVYAPIDFRFTCKLCGRETWVGHAPNDQARGIMVRCVICERGWGGHFVSIVEVVRGEPRLHCNACQAELLGGTYSIDGLLDAADAIVPEHAEQCPVMRRRRERQHFATMEVEED